MEGVLVSAKRAASTVTVTVVSDAQGRYRFPSARMQPGTYALRIRAVGYDLEGPSSVEVKAGETATVDLKLTPARDLASQLSNSEWLASFPGTDQEKASIRACAHCHTLERVARSRYDADEIDDGHRAHVDVSAALVSDEGPEARRARASAAARIRSNSGRRDGSGRRSI